MKPTQKLVSITNLKILATFSFLGSFLLARAASAHENYVLTHEQINAGMNNGGQNPFLALRDPVNIHITLAVAAGGLLTLVLYFLFQHSAAGLWFDQKIKRLENFGAVTLRVALAASLITSAYFSSYLGPEIPLSSVLKNGHALGFILYILGFMLLFGWYSRIVGVISLFIFLMATLDYKDYMLTYFNYVGEFLALSFFGSYIFSVDALLSQSSALVERYKQYEIALIRVTYGISILYPAISIKLLHPNIIVEIVNQYHLNQFHWLFPHDPMLIALGTGITQAVVGIAIVFGFQTRLNTFITFILMSMSILFFKEAVWPHYILLALALYLMINNGGEIGLDGKISKYLKRI